MIGSRKIKVAGHGNRDFVTLILGESRLHIPALHQNLAGRVLPAVQRVLGQDNRRVPAALVAQRLKAALQNVLEP